MSVLNFAAVRSVGLISLTLASLSAMADAKPDYFGAVNGDYQCDVTYEVATRHYPDAPPAYQWVLETEDRATVKMTVNEGGSIHSSPEKAVRVGPYRIGFYLQGSAFEAFVEGQTSEKQSVASHAAAMPVVTRLHGPAFLIASVAGETVRAGRNAADVLSVACRKLK